MRGGCAPARQDEGRRRGSDLKQQADIDEIADLASWPGTPGERRRLVARFVLRMLATTVLLVALYVFVPVPGTSGRGALFALAGGLVAFVVLTGYQIRSIARSRNPVIRAIEVVTFALVLVLVVFAFTYRAISEADAASFSEELGRIDAMYFTVTTLTTVGFGDITARSDAARIFVMLQMLFDLALIAGLLRMVLIATRTGLRRRGVDA